MQKKSIAIKIAAILLTAVLIAALFPAAIFAQAEEPPTVKPFYMVNFFSKDYDHQHIYDAQEYIYYAPYTWINSSTYDANSTEINIRMYFYDGYDSGDITNIAKHMKADFDKRPAGTRFFDLSAMSSVFKKLVVDAIDFEDAIRLVSDWLDRLLTTYKGMGGKLDGIIIDLEYNYGYNHYLQSHFCTDWKENITDDDGNVIETITHTPRNLDILQDIVRNERVYQTMIRPQLLALAKEGRFTFYEGTPAGNSSAQNFDLETLTTLESKVAIEIDPETGLPSNPNAAYGTRDIDDGLYPIPVSELTTINRNDSDGGNSTCRSVWDSIIQKHLTECINRAAYAPLTKHYEDAILGDYNVHDSFAWNKSMGNTGGATGNTVKAGNTSDATYYASGLSEYFFNRNTNQTERSLYKKPAGHNDAVYNPETPYGRVLYDINRQKSVLASTLENTPENKDDDHTTIHVAFFNYGNKTGYINTPYYTEMMYHMGLTNPDVFNGYILPRDVASYGADYTNPNVKDFGYVLGITNEILGELTRVAGASDRKAILTPIAWNEDYILSGMYAGGRNIWRITPNTDEVSLEGFKVAGKKAPTFQANGLTITFPQGRIIEDNEITFLGSCGYWVETPANVEPVVTSTANRYAKNPAFEETFDRYNLGVFTGSKNSIPMSSDNPIHRDTYWVKSGTGTAEIVNKNGNKVLTLTGTTTLQNTSSDVSKSPTLTVPAQITAGDKYAKQQAWEVTFTLPSNGSYGTLTLFKTRTNDGIQIKNNNVYYYDGTAPAVQISGVTLQNGGTYTAKRVVDFTGSTHKSSFYIYNANGTLLGSVTDKATGTITTPVSSIQITTTSATNAVVIDDYKLYPTSLAYDLAIYDAATGKSISDTTTVRSERTAYRMSWMNATSEYKVVEIYDVKSGAILKTVEMAPGMDGVVTGIVDASTTAPIQIATRERSGEAPALPDYDTGDFSWPGYAETLQISCYMGTEGYAKLEDALAAAKNNQTVVLLADVEMASTAVITGSTKIQHNGYTISLKNTFKGDYVFDIAPGGALTWDKDLSLDAGNKTAIRVAGGSLTVESGQISGNTGILVSGGNLTVTGGTITGTDTAIKLDQDAEKTPIAISVTGGTLTGEKAFYHCKATGTRSANVAATISGATVNGTVETAEEYFIIQRDANTYTLHGHDLIVDAAVAPNCAKTGLTEGLHYDCCGEYITITAQEVLPALGHNWTELTCVTDKACTTCGEIGTPAPGHTALPAQIETTVAASCTTEGSYDKVVYCADCGEELLRKTFTSAAVGHIDGGSKIENRVNATCTTDGSYEKVSGCAICGEESSRKTVILGATGHSYTSDTTTNPGYVTKTCTVCGDTTKTAQSVGTLKQFSIAVDDSQQNGEGITWKENLDRAYYGLNAANGRRIDWDGEANEGNYNIKVEQTANGLEVTLKDAYLKTTASYVYTMRIRYEGKVTIYLIGDNKLESGAANSPARIYVNATEGATITGTGKLTANGDGFSGSSTGADVNGDGTADVCYEYGSVIEADCDLTIKDVTLDLDQVCTTSTGPWAGHGIRCSGDVTIDNANVDIYAQYGDGIHLGTKRNTYGTAGNVTITNGAKVTIETARSHTSTTNYATIAIGDGNIYINNNETGDTEVTLKAAGYTFNKTPVLQGTCGAYADTVKDGTGATEYTAEAGLPVAIGDYRYFRYQHACVAGEPVTEKENIICAPKQDTVIYCTVCEKELSRTTTVLPVTKVHTFGPKVEIGTRTEGGLGNDQTTAGTYRFQYTCTLCGHIETAEETFRPAVFHYFSDSDAQGTNFNAFWVNNGKANGYTPKYTVNPGTTPLYFTTTTNNIAPLTDADAIKNGQWNIKLEYPLYGTPVMTLKGATIVNNAGLWYGYVGYTNNAPVKIVVEQDSSIMQVARTSGGAMNLNTTADVTITSVNNAKLSIVSYAATYATVRSRGNIIFDNANVEITKKYVAGGTNVIESANGNVVINNSTISIVGFHESSITFQSGVYAPNGDLTIRNSTFNMLGTFGGGTSNSNTISGLRAKNINIIESTVLLAHGDTVVDDTNTYPAVNGTGLFKQTVNLEYANGFYGEAVDDKKTLYDPSTDKITLPTAPAENIYTDFATFNGILTSRYRHFIKIYPQKAVAQFEGTRVGVEDDLILEFALDVTKVDRNGYALITRTKVNPDGTITTRSPLRVNLSDSSIKTETVGDLTCYVIPYAGIAAKEIRDTVTITVYDEGGNVITETKTDSVYDYAIRQLRSDKYADDSIPQNKALKTLLVDMLRYCTMAQVQFEYDNNNLVNLNLTVTEWAYASPSSAYTAKAATVTGTGYMGTAFELKSNISMLMGINTAALGEDSFAMVYVGNSTEGIRVEAEDQGNNLAVFTFKDLLAAQGRTDVTWKFYRNGEDADNTSPTLTVTDSMVNYVGRMIENYPYLEDLMKYCDSAAAYFTAV